MKKLLLISLLMSGFLFSSAQSKDALYVGIIDNHRPHVYLDSEEHPSGTLINSIKILCKDLDSECHFYTDSFFSHIEELKAGQINALLVTDSVLLPKTDGIIFTPPLCAISPVFIYKVDKGEPAFKSIDEIKNITIGVHIDSSFHLYLLDEYYSHSHIKPYSLLESGVFDLANNRIDALLAEQSFFDAQVATTTLISKKKSYYLDTISAKHIELPYKTMSLALNVNDTELHKTLTELINARGTTESCSDLVSRALKNNDSPESYPDTSETDSPVQGNEANETTQ